jgi:cob(I)alamin adenosyltransferase
LKKTTEIDSAINEARQLFNDLNMVRDRAISHRMQEKIMNVMNSLLTIKEDLSTYDEKISKLNKIEKILAE